MSNLAQLKPLLQSTAFEPVTSSNEETDLEQQIERAFWELKRAEAHLQDLLTLRQCLYWEKAQALMNLDPFPLH